MGMIWLKRIAGGLFLVGVLVVLFLAYGYFIKNTRDGGDPMKSVPPSAALVLHTQKPKALLDQLQGSNIIWERLVKKGPLPELDSSLKAMRKLVKEHRGLRALLKGRGVVISLHSVGSRSVGLQFSFGLPGSVDPEEVLGDLRKAVGPVKERSYEGVKLFEAKEGMQLAYAVRGRNLVLSRSVILVEDAVRHMKEKDVIANEKGFIKVRATTDSGLDANLYLHYPYAERLLAKFLRSSAAERLKSKGDWGKWAGMDLLLHSRSLLFTGFTHPGKEEASYLGTLMGQESRKVEIPEALPGRTAYFHAFALSDISHYLDRYESYLEGVNRDYDRDKKLKRISDSCDCDVKEEATRWIGNELAGAYIEPGKGEGLKANALIALRTFDRKAALRSLRTLGGGGDAIATEEQIAGYPEVALHQLPVDGLYQTLFGRGLPELQNPFFIMLDEHIFLSEKKKVLRELLRDRELGSLLGQDVDYDSFSDELSHRSNLLIY
ncbi:MAG: hypothetical protein ABEH38_00325, partial [Flavobacteriales bacterium]